MKKIIVALTFFVYFLSAGHSFAGIDKNCYGVYWACMSDSSPRSNLDLNQLPDEFKDLRSWKLLYGFSVYSANIHKGIIIGTSIKDPTVFFELGIFTDQFRGETTTTSMGSLQDLINANFAFQSPFGNGRINDNIGDNINYELVKKHHESDFATFITMDLGKEVIGYDFHESRTLYWFLRGIDLRVGGGLVLRTDAITSGDSFLIRKATTREKVYETPHIPDFKIISFASPALVLEPGIRFGLGIRLAAKYSILLSGEPLEMALLGFEF